MYWQSTKLIRRLHCLGAHARALLTFPCFYNVDWDQMNIFALVLVARSLMSTLFRKFFNWRISTLKTRLQRAVCRTSLMRKIISHRTLSCFFYILLLFFWRQQQVCRSGRRRSASRTRSCLTTRTSCTLASSWLRPICAQLQWASLMAPYAIQQYKESRTLRLLIPSVKNYCVFFLTGNSTQCCVYTQRCRESRRANMVPLFC